MSNRGRYKPSQEADHYHKRTSRKPLVDVNGRLLFGKYRDWMLVDVIKKDPSWVDWAKQNITGFSTLVKQFIPKPTQVPFSFLDDSLDSTPTFSSGEQLSIENNPETPPWPQ